MRCFLSSRSLLAVLLAMLPACGGNVIVDGAGGNGAAGTGASTTTPTCSSGSSLTCEVSPGIEGHVCATICGSGLTTCPSGNPVSSCPTVGALGTCSSSYMDSVFTVSKSVVYYTDTGYSAMDAESDCTSGGGTWTPA